MKYKFNANIYRVNKYKMMVIAFEFDQRKKQLNEDSIQVFEDGKEIRNYSKSLVLCEIYEFLAERGLIRYD